jgi:hypothetical protein
MYISLFILGLFVIFHVYQEGAYDKELLFDQGGGMGVVSCHHHKQNIYF